MRGRRLILPLAMLAGLVVPAPASAIVDGQTVPKGEFPAQAFIKIDGGPDPDRFCSGTLVGSRQVLTSARCATIPVFGDSVPAASFTVRLGDVDLTSTPADEYAVTANDVNADYDGDGRNDVAMLTLNRAAPAALTPERVVDDTEKAAWAPGTEARVLGWGETSTPGGSRTLRLRTGLVTIRQDASCPDGSFSATTMLCAAAPSDAGNPCAGDAGSPLLVTDGDFHSLVGVFSGLDVAGSCTSPTAPAVFARIGAQPLNKWVHDRTPEANFALSHQPRATEPVTLTSTSTYPPPGAAGDSFFDTFRWDLDGDGDFDRAGKQISHAFPSAGTAIVGIEASNRAQGDRAVAYYAFEVEPAPSSPGTTTPGPGPSTPPPATTPIAQPPLATILVSGRPKVRRGRFPIRVRFAQGAPSGVAVIEVYRRGRKIGVGRTRVKQGATKRVRVKLNRRGRRMLRRSKTKRMRIRARVRVGSDVLRTRRLTIRR